MAEEPKARRSCRRRRLWVGAALVAASFAAGWLWARPPRVPWLPSEPLAWVGRLPYGTKLKALPARTHLMLGEASDPSFLVVDAVTGKVRCVPGLWRVGAREGVPASVDGSKWLTWERQWGRGTFELRLADLPGGHLSRVRAGALPRSGGVRLEPQQRRHGRRPEAAWRDLRGGHPGRRRRAGGEQLLARAHVEPELCGGPAGQHTPRTVVA